MFNRKTITIVTLFTFILIGCKSCEKKVEVVEAIDSDNQVASLNNTFLSDPVGPYNQVAGVPSLWESFESFFKNCVKNSNFPEKSLFGKYRLLYLGPSNPRYLGTVYSHNGVVPKTELTKWLTPDQLNQFISPGNEVPGCDITEIKDKFLSLVLGKVPVVGTDTTLKFVLENKDTIVNSVGSWAIDGINTAEFIKFLDENSSDKNIAFYRNVMTDKNNVVAFQVVKVTGFGADIHLAKDLKVSMDLNIPVLKAKNASGKDSTFCAFNFHKTSDRVIHVESSGQFYAFALVMKGKKVN
jgi:hypothetical protein